MVPNLVEKFRYHLETPYLNPEILFASKHRYIGQCSSFLPQEPETQRLSK